MTNLTPLQRERLAWMAKNPKENCLITSRAWSSYSKLMSVASGLFEAGLVERHLGEGTTVIFSISAAGLKAVA